MISGLGTINTIKVGSSTIKDVVVGDTHVWTAPSNLTFASTYNILKSGSNYYRQLKCTNNSNFAIQFQANSNFLYIGSGNSGFIQHKIGTSYSDTTGSTFTFQINYLDTVIKVSSKFDGNVISQV